MAEELEEEFVPNFDENDLKNIIYREVIQIVEPLEFKGKYKGNSHHLTQEICEKLSPVIMKKIDLVAEQKVKISWKQKR